tara:strand:+ start:51467 stop:51784 length:318 start_codon:yes stop_codon:yes gene_type:complete
MSPPISHTGYSHLTNLQMTSPETIDVPKEDYEAWKLLLTTFAEGYQVLAESWMQLRLKEPTVVEKHNYLFGRVKLEMAAVKAKSLEIAKDGPGEYAGWTDQSLHN